MSTFFAPLRVISGMFLTLGAACPLVALDDDFGRDEQGGSIGLWLEAQLSSSFSLADVRKEWVESQRIELGFRAAMPAEGASVPFIHCGLFYEDRTWEEEDQSVDLEAFGLSVSGGIELRVIGRAGGPLVWVSSPGRASVWHPSTRSSTMSSMMISRRCSVAASTSVGSMARQALTCA